MLIQNSAQVNQQNDLKNTPLHLAARYDKTDFVKFLIKNAADIEAKNLDGQTPIDIAKSRGIFFTFLTNSDMFDLKCLKLFILIKLYIKF